MEPVIYDTTLREGLQTPGGIGGSLAERIYAANLIARFVDWVELGMPANNVDYKIIEAVKNSFIENEREAGIAVLCRNKELDIDRAEEVLQGYHTTLAHLFIGTSQEHRNHRFKGGWTKEDYEKNIESMVEYAASKNFTRVMFSPEDSFRTFQECEEDFFDFVDAAIRGYERGSAKVDRKAKLILNFPDTVGKSTISEFNAMLEKIKEKYGDKIEISVHGHNDTASSTQQAAEVYIRGLANWLQTTFAGLGERNGITPTEGILAIIDQRGYLRNKRYGNEDVLRDLVPATHAILGALGKTVPAESIVSGSRVNTSVAGIHSDIAMKDNITYHIHGDRYGALPMIEFGPSSGGHQIVPLLQKIGIERQKSDPDVVEFTDMLKEKCNKEKRSLNETDITYEAIRFFKRGFKHPLKIYGYTLTVRRDSQPVIEIEGIYDDIHFKQKDDEDVGTVEGVVGMLSRVLNMSRRRKLQLVRFEPVVVPKIPEQYLHWEKGSFPEIPRGLDIHSDFRVTTGIKDASNGDNVVYYGTYSGEDTVKTIIESAIDAILKMESIRKWCRSMHPTEKKQ